MASTALISGEFFAQPGQSDPSQLQAVFQGYGSLTSAPLPSPALTLSNGDGLGKTYFKLLATLTDGSVLYAFQTDDPVAVAFIGTIIIKYAGQVIATFPQTPDLSNLVQINGVGPVGTIGSLAGATVYVVSPVSNGTIRIVQGSGYSVADGNALVFETPTDGGWPTDFTGWTQLLLTATKNANNPNPGDASLSWAATIGVASGALQQLVCQPTDVQTGTLAIATAGNKGYDFKLQGLSPNSGNTVVLLEGALIVSA